MATVGELVAELLKLPQEDEISFNVTHGVAINHAPKKDTEPVKE